MAARRLISILSTLALGAALAAGLARCRSQSPGGADGPRVEVVEIAGERFELELAIDDAARAHGLKERTSIPDDGGMLFVFPDPQRHAFWMHRCLVDIDLMFLDPRGRVTALHRMPAEPPQGPDESDAEYERRMRRTMYPSGHPAQFAIELKSGSLDRLGLRVGDRVDLDLDRLKGLAR